MKKKIIPINRAEEVFLKYIILLCVPLKIIAQKYVTEEEINQHKNKPINVKLNIRILLFI